MRVTVLLQDRLDPAGADNEVPRHPVVVPEGYMLTTRLMCHEYFDVGNGCPQGEHTHPEHLVFWPTQGTGSVAVGGSWHSLTVGQGLWVPADTPHVIERTPASTLAAVHIHPLSWKGADLAVRPVMVPPALRELLLYLMPVPMPKDQRLRAQQVCLELLADEARPTLELVMPKDERIASIAQSLLLNPADGRTIEEWSWLVSLSSRTIARAFRDSTGITFNEWRTRARMVRAIDLLGEGVPVGLVARRVGYATIGAFSNAFSRVLGRRPHEFHPTRG